MRIELNGRPTVLPEGATVADAVAAAGAPTEDMRGVAAAVAGKVIPRSGWERQALAEGEEVEVVRAVQGG